MPLKCGNPRWDHDQAVDRPSPGSGSSPTRTRVWLLGTPWPLGQRVLCRSDRVSGVAVPSTSMVGLAASVCMELQRLPICHSRVRRSGSEKGEEHQRRAVLIPRTWTETYDRGEILTLRLWISQPQYFLNVLLAMTMRATASRCVPWLAATALPTLIRESSLRLCQLADRYQCDLVCAALVSCQSQPRPHCRLGSGL